MRPENLNSDKLPGGVDAAGGMCFQTSPRAAHSAISEPLHKVAQWERSGQAISQLFLQVVSGHLCTRDPPHHLLIPSSSFTLNC